MKIILSLWLFLFSLPLLSAQNVTKTLWPEAKTLCNDNQYLKAKPLLLAVYNESPRSLCGYWLGMVYDIENQRDSAVFYYKSAIKNSIRKPQLAAWDNLIHTQLRQLDFEGAYATAWEALQKFPGNTTFIEAYKEVCIWSYFINHLKFDKNYLSNTELQKEYSVKTVTEQNLIIKNICGKQAQSLRVSNRQYKGIYEIWKCYYNGSKTLIDVKFNLEDHDLDRQLKEQAATAKATYNNKENSIDIRLGALLAFLPISDKQMLDLLASDQEAIRFCTCTEVKSSTSKKVKKTCLADSSELIKATCEQLNAFK